MISTGGKRGKVGRKEGRNPWSSDVKLTASCSGPRPHQDGDGESKETSNKHKSRSSANISSPKENTWWSQVQLTTSNNTITQTSKATRTGFHFPSSFCPFKEKHWDHSAPYFLFNTQECDEEAQGNVSGKIHSHLCICPKLKAESFRI